MRAECIWKGPDIILVGEVTEDQLWITGKQHVKDTCLLLEEPHSKDKWLHGAVNHFHIDLSVKEARQLIISLEKAIVQCEEMDVVYNGQCERGIWTKL